MKKLSRATYEMVRCLFAPEQQETAAGIVALRCGDNLPFLENQNEEGLEPVRFAVLKLSRGNLRELEWWVGIAQHDWRDVVRAAGFSSGGTAHRQWAAEVYRARASAEPRTSTWPNET